MRGTPEQGQHGALWCVPGLGAVPAGGSHAEGAVGGPGWAGEAVEPPASVEALIGHLASVAASISVLREGMAQLSGTDLERVMGGLGDATVAVEAMTVETAAEAISRDIPAAGPTALSPVEWVRGLNPAYRGSGAAALVRAAEVSRAGSFPQLAEAVRAGVVPVAVVAAAVETHYQVIGALPAAWAGSDEVRAAIGAAITTAATSASVREVRSMGRELISRFGRDQVLERQAEIAHTRRELSTPVEVATGVYEYLLRLDAPGMARLEAALDPVSRPCPDQGGPDPRSARQRRADGLLTLVEAAVAAPEGPGAGMRATLVVTMSLDALRTSLTSPDRGGSACGGFGELRLGEVLGQTGAAAAAHLTPTQVRQLSCQAGLTPAVLDADGVIVDQGRLTRLFPPALVRRLWIRDRRCSYPGCTMPAKWTQAHHLVHWSDGGRTTLSNAALLCARHHTVVHTRRLHGEVRDDRVHWDLTPGSYHRRE